MSPFARCGDNGNFNCRQNASQSLSPAFFQRRNHFKPYATCAISSAIPRILSEQFGQVGIAHHLKPAREVTAEIEVRLFERQGQSRHIIHRAFHRSHGAPEITAHRQLAEVNAALSHALGIKPRVRLLILERLPEPAPERRRRIGKTQQRQRHQFRRQQLVIRKKMQQPPALLVAFQPMHPREIRFARTLRLELQLGRSPGKFRREQG